MKTIIPYLFCLLSITGFGQYKFHNLSINNGLSQNSVNNVFRDSKGYYWISTNDGLNLYNGSTIRHFRKNQKDNRTLSDNFIIETTEDYFGNIWIGTRHCLNRYNRRQRSFLRIDSKTFGEPITGHNTIGKLYVAQNGDLYYNIRSYLLRIKKNELNKLSPNIDTLSNFITGFCFDKKDTLNYIAINKYGKGSGFLSHLNPPEYVFSKTTNDCIDQIFECNEKIAVIRCGKLICFDPLKRTSIDYSGFLPPNATINTAKYLNKQELLVGTSIGLYKINLFNNYANRVFFSNNTFDGASEETVISISITCDSVLWIGTASRGVYFTDLKNKNVRIINSVQFPEIKSDQFNCSFKYKNNFYAGTNKGVIQFNNKEVDPIIFSEDLRVKDICMDGDENLWLATNTGIHVFNNRLQEIKYFTTKNSNLLTNNIFKLVYNSFSNDIWVGTYNGLYKINTKSSLMTSYLESSGNLASGYVMDLQVDKTNLWCAHAAGVSKLDLRTEQLTNYGVASLGTLKPSHRICSALLVDGNSIWIATLGSGIDKLNFETNTMENYSTSDGLCSDMISGLAKDRNGIIWAATYNGLVKFDPKTKRVLNYNLKDGLSNNECSLGGIYVNNDDLFVCTSSGLNILNIQENNHNEILKQPDIESIVLNGECLDWIEDSDSIILNSESNRLLLNVHYPDLFNGKHLSCYYKIDGLTNFPNIQEEGIMKLYLNNIPFGIHIMEIFVTEGEKGKTSTALKVYLVNELPLYKNKYFWLIISIFLIILIVSSILFFQHRKHKQNLNKLKLEQKLLLEKERISKDLHDNIGSQLTYIIRNLDFIDSDLMEKGISINTIKELGEITRDTVQQLRDTIWATNHKSISADEFWHRVKSFLINYLTYYDEIEIITSLDGNPQTQLNPTILLQLFRIIQEATHNIIKHSNAKIINANLTLTKDTLILVIKDNGVGFKYKEIDGKYGLKNMKERANEMGGIMEINSEINNGTTIKVIIPIRDE